MSNGGPAADNSSARNNASTASNSGTAANSNGLTPAGANVPGGYLNANGQLVNADGTPYNYSGTGATTGTGHGASGLTGGALTTGGTNTGSATTITGGTTTTNNSTGGIIAGTNPNLNPGTVPQITGQFGYSPVQSGMDASLDTTAGQLENIMANGGPAVQSLMQNAATGANQQFNQTGTLHSTMAEQAADTAMLNAATPIAQSDAAANLQNQQLNTQNWNAALASNAQLAATVAGQNLSAASQNAIANLQAATSISTTGMSTASQQAIAQLGSATQVSIAQANINNAKLLQTSSSASTIYEYYLNAIQSVFSNPNITDPNAMTADVNNLFGQMQSALNTVGSIGGVGNIGSLLTNTYSNPNSSTTSTTGGG